MASLWVGAGPMVGPAPLCGAGSHVATPIMPKKPKHTPGPWETGALLTRVEVLPAGWRMPACVADCDTKHAPGTQEERVANARLIAAAPDLLAALCALEAAGLAPAKDRPRLNDEAWARARDAIARATGG